MQKNGGMDVDDLNVNEKEKMCLKGSGGLKSGGVANGCWVVH